MIILLIIEDNGNVSNEISAIHEKMWGKYCTARQATVDNMAHAHCTLDN
jgi:hypothetical protein